MECASYGIFKVYQSIDYMTITINNYLNYQLRFKNNNVTKVVINNFETSQGMKSSARIIHANNQIIDFSAIKNDNNISLLTVL